MNTSRFHAVAVILALHFTPGARGEPLTTEQPSPEEMAAELGIELPPRPWHLVDIWWNFEGPIPHFESLSVDVTIDRDIPSTHNLYIAPVGVAKINGLQFYGGLQSNINGWASKESRTRVHPGKGAIFSRWSHDKKQPIGLGHVRTAVNGLCESAGYEGQFCSVRRPFAWSKGTYTYSIVKGDTETVDDQPHTWFHCLVRSHETGMTTYIGSLRFEGTDFTFWSRQAAFAEVYATHKIPRAGIPKVTITFGYPLINGSTPPLKNASAHYNPSGSPACATARKDDTTVVVEIGSLFLREEEKGHHSL
jgi:hypothetical protein